MSQKNKRALLSDAILNMDNDGPDTPAVPPSGNGPQGIVATALDMHREGLKERLDSLEQATAAARARGDILEEIAPDFIDDPLPADRHQRFRDDVALDELTRSIEVNGQHVPILVRRHDRQDGRFEVAAGRRRLEACRRLQRPVLARVLILDDPAMLDLQYRENAERSDVTLFERARWFLAVQDQLKASTTALAKRFELSQPMMVEYLKLARLPDALIDALDDPRDLTIAHAKKLHTILGSARDAEQLLIEALNQTRKGQGTKTQIAKAIAQLAAPTTTPTNRVIKNHQGRALLTVTQSGRQTVFRWAPDMDSATISRIADAIPTLLADITKE